jgi:hypothetical protein
MPLTTAQKLAEAEQAYHEIITGVAVSRYVDQNGESVSYSKANAKDLLAYIAYLKNLLAEEAGATAHRGPLRFVFGMPRGIR